RIREALDRLTDPERQLLAVCRRYGGSISGELLLAEGMARGLLEAPKRDTVMFGRPRKEDVVHALLNKLLLFRADGRHPRNDFSSFFPYRHTLPEVVMPAAVGEVVEPAVPLTWPAGKTAGPPEGGHHRAPAAVALDLWAVATALQQGGPWKTNRGGAL